jgi:hypothetical protein
VAAAELALPCRIASAPQFHSARAPAPHFLAADAVLPHAAPLPAEWCVCILAAAHKHVIEGKTPPKAWFVDPDAKLTLTIEALEAAGAARAPLQAGPYVPTTGARADLAKSGKGLFFIPTKDVASFLERPGTYRLTFRVAGDGMLKGAAVAPLVVRLSRAALCALDLTCTWAACVHAGECTLNKHKRCRLMDRALADKRCDMVLGGPPLALPVYLSQVDSKDRPVRFPADVASQLRVSVWDTNEAGDAAADGAGGSADADESRPQAQLDVTAAAINPALVQLSDDGMEVIISGLQLVQGRLPVGDAMDDVNRQSRAGPAAPLRALLRISIDSARLVGKRGSTLQLRGGAEVEICVVPGNARSIAAAWDADAGELKPGDDLHLRAELRDAWGNPTLRLNDGTPAAALSMPLVNLKPVQRGADASSLSLAKAGKLGIGSATLRIDSKFSEAFKVTLQSPGLPAVALRGNTCTRTLRVGVAGPLHAEAGGQLQALPCTVRVMRSRDALRAPAAHARACRCAPATRRSRARTSTVRC